MLYLVIGLFVVAAVVIFSRQPSQNPNTSTEENKDAQENNNNSNPENEVVEDPRAVKSAKPVTAPDLASGATYSSAASSGDDSPYGYSGNNKKARASENLLRWCGRGGNIQISNFVIQGPVAYWSNGTSDTEEPSCIDVTLEVGFPQEHEEITYDFENYSYAAMTPVQRGIYLTWLAGGRIQPPRHICYPILWLCGIERRAIIDKLDLGICIAETFRLLPLMRWPEIIHRIIQFITWLAVKIWLPDDDLLTLFKRLNTVPEAMLCIILTSYANSKLALPSMVAFTLMRTSEKLRGEDAKPMSHSEYLLEKFTPIYKELCAGGIVLNKPSNVMTISYTPLNPSIDSDTKTGTIEILNFFEDLRPFEPLIEAWHVFASGLTETEDEKLTAEIMLEDRPDFENFIDSLREANRQNNPNSDNSSGEGEIELENDDVPLVTTLQELGTLIKINVNADKKVRGGERKSMIDTAQVEGWQIVPDLGISGREYVWDEKILFIPLEPGTKLSADYRIASFILEFICSLIYAREERLFEPLRQRLNTYFNLNDSDNIRLDAQKVLNLPTQHEPDFYGEFISVWLSVEEKIKLKNFVLSIIEFMPELRDNDDIRPRLCSILSIKDTDPTPEQKRMPPANFGAEIVKIMSMLFKNN